MGPGRQAQQGWGMETEPFPPQRAAWACFLPGVSDTGEPPVTRVTPPQDLDPASLSPLAILRLRWLGGPQSIGIA